MIQIRVNKHNETKLTEIARKTGVRKQLLVVDAVETFIRFYRSLNIAS